jgi:hypothetical protein
MKGLEPSTFCMASRRSSQLSYIRASAQYRSGAAIARALRGALWSLARGPRGEPGAAICDQLPVAGGRILAPWPPAMFGQLCPPVAPVAPVAELAPAGKPEPDVELVLVLVLGADVAPLDAACATVAPATAAAALRTASIPIMRGRKVEPSFAVAGRDQ